MIKTVDLSIIKVAMEYATFSDFTIRDGVNSLIHALELDLDEVGFEMSANTKEVVERLESCITEVETARNPRPDRFEIKEEETEGVIEKSVNEEMDELTHSVINVDEELDELES